MATTTLLTEVTIRHRYSGEERTLKVDAILPKKIVIFWPLAGSYELNLIKNELRSRSLKARSKSPQGCSVWYCPDIEVVRGKVKDHLAGYNRQQELERRLAKHDATKPGSNTGIAPRESDAIIPSPYLKKGYGHA